MTAFKYFIKGTDFELLDFRQTTLDPEMAQYKCRGGYRPFIPMAWVEKRKVERQEPSNFGSLERDVQGHLWMRNFAGQWISSNTWYGKSKMVNWAELQVEHGPTKPVKVVPRKTDDE